MEKVRQDKRAGECPAGWKQVASLQMVEKQGSQRR